MARRVPGSLASKLPDGDQSQPDSELPALSLTSSLKWESVLRSGVPVGVYTHMSQLHKSDIPQG